MSRTDYLGEVAAAFRRLELYSPRMTGVAIDNNDDHQGRYGVVLWSGLGRWEASEETLAESIGAAIEDARDDQFGFEYAKWVELDPEPHLEPTEDIALMGDGTDPRYFVEGTEIFYPRRILTTTGRLQVNRGMNGWQDDEEKHQASTYWRATDIPAKNRIYCTTVANMIDMYRRDWEMPTHMEQSEAGCARDPRKMKEEG